MRRALIIAALLTCGFATPTYAQGDATSSCVAQNLQTVVQPLLMQAMQFSPQGMNGTYVPMSQPFAPGAYAFPPGVPPGPPSLAPPTAAYNLSSLYTGLSALPPPGTLASQQIAQFLIQSGRVNPAAPNPANAELYIALANLQQTEQARTQQQALLAQQQGQYLNSLYQLSSSYQVTSLDWQEAYSSLASAWMNYINSMCGAAASGASAGVAPSPTLSTTENQPVPTYPAGNYPGTMCGAPGYPCLPPGVGR